MYRLLNTRILIVVIMAAITIALFSTAINSCSNKTLVMAKVSDVLVHPNTPFSFADSTLGAKEWLWEFGNGDKLSSAKGNYSYSETGKYQIRLTVNNKFKKFFLIDVKETEKVAEEDELTHIIAPSKAMQKEMIVFKGVGNSEKWRWEFGETGLIDSRDQKTIYSYSQPGIYDVLLSTEKTKYPIHHRIEIVSQYQEHDTTDVLSLIGIDIKENLQSIIDGKSFNKHYNIILKKYLCNKPNTVVVTNNNKYNDFYSYCQGLKIIGKANNTIIKHVLVDIDKENESCIEKVTVIQYDLKN